MKQHKEDLFAERLPMKVEDTLREFFDYNPENKNVSIPALNHNQLIALKIKKQRHIDNVFKEVIDIHVLAKVNMATGTCRCCSYQWNEDDEVIEAAIITLS